MQVLFLFALNELFSFSKCDRNKHPPAKLVVFHMRAKPFALRDTSNV